MKNIRITTAVLLLSTVCSAQYLDSRNRAMGGTGVASSHYTSAGFVNPALLTHFGESDNFGFIFPTVSAAVADEDGLREAIEDFQDEVDRLQVALGNLSVTPTQRAELAASLNNLNGKRADASIGTAVSVAFASEGFSWAFLFSAQLDGQVTPIIQPTDTAIILGSVNPADLDTLTSEGVILGSLVTEIGFAAAKEFSIGGIGVSVGATPKIQRVETYNYSININTFEDGLDDFTDSQYRDDSTEFNIDLGVAAKVIPGMLTVGLVARNLIEQDFDTVVTNGRMFTRELGPSVKLGAALTAGGFTVAADVDVTGIERYKNIADDVQFVNLGAEYNALGWLQVRGGVQTDLEDTVNDLFSLGLGFSPADLIHIDITGIYGEGDSYGATFQLWFTF